MPWVRFLSLIALGVLVIFGLLNVNYSDDDNPTKPEGTWSWTLLGSGVNGSVGVLTVYSDKLIAGGYFDTAGLVNSNNIAAWYQK